MFADVLKLNDKNFKFTFYSRIWTTCIIVVLDGAALAKVEEIRDLAVVLDCMLNYNSYIYLFIYSFN